MIRGGQYCEAESKRSETAPTHVARRGSRDSTSCIRRDGRPNTLGQSDRGLFPSQSRSGRRNVGRQDRARHGFFTGRGGLDDVGREDVGVGFGGDAEDLTEVDVGALVVDLGNDECEPEVNVEMKCRNTESLPEGYSCIEQCRPKNKYPAIPNKYCRRPNPLHQPSPLSFNHTHPAYSTTHSPVTTT
jgi:hypothetical protein